MLIISPTSGLTARTRLYKVSQLITSLNLSIEHWGWLRSNNDMIVESPDLNIKKKKYLLNGGGYGNKYNKLMYVLWVSIVFIKLILHKKTKIWALGLETAFPAVLASYIRGHEVIFDDADRLVLLFDFSGVTFKVIRAIEMFTSNRSQYHIIPSILRYDYKSKSFIELKNLPTKENVRVAKTSLIPEEITSFTKNKIVVYANGWLSNTRGADFIVDFIEKVNQQGLSEHVSLIVAGRVDSSELKNKLDDKICVVVPEMKYEKALSLYKISDYVITLYDPKVAINRYAESNKWGDALSFFVTPVINKEVITAGFIEPVSIMVEYNNSDGLLNSIKERLANKSSVKSDEIKRISNLLTPFEDGVLKVLKGKL